MTEVGHFSYRGTLGQVFGARMKMNVQREKLSAKGENDVTIWLAHLHACVRVKFQDR